MVAAGPLMKMSFAEYLATEDASPAKREWIHGEAWAMSGGTLEHSALAATILRVLGNEFLGRPCKAFTSDARIRVPATGLAAYPDVTVVCGPIERDPEDDHAITNPTALFEVLSPSTEDWDRGGKWAHYRRLPSLRHYVLFEDGEPRVELHSRQDDGTWVLRDLAAGGKIELQALDFTLEIDVIYDEAFVGLA